MSENVKSLAPRRSKQAFGLQQIVIFCVLVALIVFLCVMSKSFRRYTTIVQICIFMYYILLMAIGVTFPLITGGVDLSIGTGLVCYSVIGSYLIRINGWPIGWTIVLVLAMGILVGFVNGTIISRLELPPFITTLCTMMICRGLGSILTNSFCGTWPTVNQPGGWVRNLIKIVGEDKTIYPVGMIWIVLLVIIMTLVLNHTRAGRYIIGIGSNKEALRLSGVNVIRWQTVAYMISGFFAGLAAIAYAATFSTITPGTGAGFELDAIGAAIIGGTAMTGGSGSIIGTFLGVCIISVLKTGLPFIGLQANWQQVITGLILIVAVTMDVVRNSKRT